MTRITADQVAEAWDAIEKPFAPWRVWSKPTQDNILAFAHRIAALAVQEVERERRNLEIQFKQVTRWHQDECVVSRDALREVATLTAQLAEVTKERDFYRLDAERHAQFADSYRAQLSSDKREALVPCRECAGSGLVPATPSGETKCADVSGCDGKCCATPSPEAREVDSEFLLRVVQEVNAYAVITPADAKRIVAMARTGGTE